MHTVDSWFPEVLWPCSDVESRPKRRGQNSEADVVARTTTRTKPRPSLRGQGRGRPHVRYLWIRTQKKMCCWHSRHVFNKMATMPTTHIGYNNTNLWKIWRFEIWFQIWVKEVWGWARNWHLRYGFKSICTRFGIGIEIWFGPQVLHCLHFSLCFL